jgi:ferritin-like metal-binding protein YciE
MFRAKRPQTLHELWVDSLRDIYDGEQQLTKTLPEMAQAATSLELRRVLMDHLSRTELQASRLEELFDRFDIRDRSKKCDGIRGLIEEAAETFDDGFEPRVRDAAIVAAVQKIEHYEIAVYGTLIAWAGLLGRTEAAAILGESLNEERSADESLTQAAMHWINVAAA